MPIIALDTSLNACSVAIVGKDTYFNQTEEMERGQAEAIIPMIHNAIANAKISFSDLKAIAVTVGPGSFTGIRISLSAAKALGLALTIPVIGLTTTEVLIQSAIKKNNKVDIVTAIVETKRDDFYFQILNKTNNNISSPNTFKQQEITNALLSIDPTYSIVLTGDGLPRFMLNNNSFYQNKNITIDEQKAPDPLQLAIMARDKLDILLSSKIPAERFMESYPSPHYIRPPDVSFPGGKQLL